MGQWFLEIGFEGFAHESESQNAMQPARSFAQDLASPSARSFAHRIPHEMIEASFMREAFRHLPLENQMSHASHASHTSHPQAESTFPSPFTFTPPNVRRRKQTTKRGEAEVAKADRPQPRRGASAAANTRKCFSRVEMEKCRNVEMSFAAKNARKDYPQILTNHHKSDLYRCV